MGHVAKQRPGVDAENFVILPAPAQKFGRDVLVKGWNMFAGCTSHPCSLYLQVWRLVPGSTKTYRLIGQSSFSPSVQPEFHTIHLDESQYIRANAGDIVGISFDDGSVRYSYVPLSAGDPICLDPAQAALYSPKNPPLTLLTDHTIEFEDPNCRFYSFNPIYSVLWTVCITEFHDGILQAVHTVMEVHTETFVEFN